MAAAADGNHGGDVGLAAQAAATWGSRPYGLSPPLRGDRGPLGLSPPLRGDRGPLGLSPPRQSTLGCDHNPLLCTGNEQISACRGIPLTEMSDAGSFVGKFRSLLLQIADNASAAPTPDQTARQLVLKVRPAEADQAPEEVDGCLVCSCCSPSYA